MGTRKLLTCVSVCAALIAGCSDHDGGSEFSSEQAAPPTEDKLLEQQAVRPGSPSVANFSILDVTALGTGCNNNTIVKQTGTDPDGKTFYNIEFLDYKIMANAAQASPVQVKDCNLTVRIVAARGFQYAIVSVAYEGYAVLQKGMNADFTSTHSFSGTPSGKTLKAHFDGPYGLGPNPGFKLPASLDETTALDYGPCDKDRDLILTTRLIVRNSSPKQDGEVGVTYLKGGISDAPANGRLRIRLATRRCI